MPGARATPLRTGCPVDIHLVKVYEWTKADIERLEIRWR